MRGLLVYRYLLLALSLGRVGGVVHLLRHRHCADDAREAACYCDLGLRTRDVPTAEVRHGALPGLGGLRLPVRAAGRAARGACGPCPVGGRAADRGDASRAANPAALAILTQLEA